MDSVDRRGAFHAGERTLQKSVGVKDGTAMRRAIHATLPPVAMDFLAEQNLIALATVDPSGAPWASALVGPAGFVQALDERRVSIARAALDRASHENLAVGADLGVLAIEPASRRRMRVNGRVESMDPERVVLTVDEVFSNCPKYIQARAPAVEVQTFGREVTRSDRAELSAADRTRVSSADTFFIATRHAITGADASHRGGKPGFVRARSSRLTFPDYVGNHMFQSLGNLLVDDRVGLVFFDFDTGTSLQVVGHASITRDEGRVAEFAGAQRVVDVEVTRVVSADRRDMVPWNFAGYSNTLPDITVRPPAASPRRTPSSS